MTVRLSPMLRLLAVILVVLLSGPGAAHGGCPGFGAVGFDDAGCGEAAESGHDWRIPDPGGPWGDCLTDGAVCARGCASPCALAVAIIGGTPDLPAMPRAGHASSPDPARDGLPPVLHEHPPDL